MIKNHPVLFLAALGLLAIGACVELNHCCVKQDGKDHSTWMRYHYKLTQGTCGAQKCPPLPPADPSGPCCAGPGQKRG